MATNPNNRSTHEPLSLNGFYDDLNVLTPFRELQERMLVYDFYSDDVFFINKIHRLKGKIDGSTTIHLGLVEHPELPELKTTKGTAFTHYTAHTVSRMLPIGYVDDHSRIVYTDFVFKEEIYNAEKS